MGEVTKATLAEPLWIPASELNGPPGLIKFTLPYHISLTTILQLFSVENTQIIRMVRVCCKESDPYLDKCIGYAYVSLYKCWSSHTHFSIHSSIPSSLSPSVYPSIHQFINQSIKKQNNQSISGSLIRFVFTVVSCRLYDWKNLIRNIKMNWRRPVNYRINRTNRYV